jgi:hypothetical protein
MPTQRVTQICRVPTSRIGNETNRPNLRERIEKGAELTRPRIRGRARESRTRHGRIDRPQSLISAESFWSLDRGLGQEANTLRALSSEPAAVPSVVFKA